MKHDLIVCPKCGIDNENEFDFWVDDNGNWSWNCFRCGHKWKEIINSRKEE